MFYITHEAALSNLSYSFAGRVSIKNIKGGFVVNQGAHAIPPGYVKFNPNLLNRLSSPFQSRGYEVLVSASANDFLGILSPFQKVALSQKLYSLAGNPRPDTEIRHKKHTVDKYYIAERKTGFSISYEIIDGRVFVHSVTPDPSAFGEHKEVPACYLVKNGGPAGWVITETDTKQVSTKYAAVNGQSNVLARAKDLMAAHLQFTYDSNLTEYTLFHNPSDGGMWDTYESSLDKRGHTTGVTKEFSKILKSVQDKGRDVSWVAHSQGGIIFTEAVRFHLENAGKGLDKNSVTFNAGANNKKITDKVLGQARVTIHAYNDHPFDLVPQLVGSRAGANVSNIVGSVLHAGYVLKGSAQRSPHTLPYQGMDNYVEQMPGWYKVMYKLLN